jgi:hypothetical protein
MPATLTSILGVLADTTTDDLSILPEINTHATCSEVERRKYTP